MSYQQIIKYQLDLGEMSCLLEAPICWKAGGGGEGVLEEQN